KREKRIQETPGRAGISYQTPEVDPPFFEQILLNTKYFHINYKYTCNAKAAEHQHTRTSESMDTGIDHDQTPVNWHSGDHSPHSYGLDHQPYLRAPDAGRSC